MSKDRVSLPQPQLKVLMMRNGRHCAFDGCAALLYEPGSGPYDAASVVAEIAHISAVSPGGARYKADMTPEQRGRSENLIVLCERHHKVIDDQRHTYTFEVVSKMKETHELAVARAGRYSMAEVGFPELEAVCAFLRTSHRELEPDAFESLTLPPKVAEKIRLNSLGAVTSDQIRIGLSKTDEVARYIDFTNQLAPNFSLKLRAWFKREYASGQLAGLSPDDLFSYLCAVAHDNAGAVDSDVIRSASVAVVVHLFEICELFQGEDATSR